MTGHPEKWFLATSVAREGSVPGLNGFRALKATAQELNEMCAVFSVRGSTNSNSRDSEMGTQHLCAVNEEEDLSRRLQQRQQW